MKILYLLMMISQASSTFIEKRLDFVKMDASLASLSNGIKRQNGWALKNGEAGSILNFKNRNNNLDEWSIEIVFDEPSLTHPDFSGIYLWYTEDQVTHGNYKGGNGKFNGVLVGVEFVGKALDIVVSVNHGQIDYGTVKEDETELKDSPEPSIFKGHKELTLKVISTQKNFKIEIYGDDHKLLYDRVRYTSMTEIGTRLSGKYYSISTVYHTTKATEGILLKDIRLFSREEQEDYDPSVFHTEIPEITPRVPHQVNHPEEEIQHTIAGIEHLTKYLRVVLGEPQSKPVAENVMYLKKVLNFQTAHVFEIRDSLKAIAEIGKKHSEREEESRMEVLQMLSRIQASVNNTRPQEEKESTEGISLLNLLLFCAISFGAGYVLSLRLNSAKKTAIH
ncbi:hypothetical protein NEOKW01_1989 [Nematocida sp. AWRm80]|nr:hypothetical protein NEOKW01_1989 [Nematocida sp. AWRm80]